MSEPRAVSPTDDPFDLTVYVPCLNEEGNIAAVLEMVAEAVAAHELRAEILVFDDGSTDATAEVAAEALERIGDADPRLCTELIRLPESRGLGANFFAGAERGRGEHYLLVNGDHSERLETLDAVLGRLGEADLVVTIFDEGDARGPARRALSRLFTFLVNRLNGHELGYYNGPTLHRRQDVVRFATDCHGFAYQAELLTRELDAGRSFVEVPMISRQREAGVTKAFAPRNLLSVAQSLWRIRTRRFESSPPHALTPPTPWPPAAVLGFLLVLLLAAVLRLSALDRADLRSDELAHFLRLQQRPGTVELMVDHFEEFTRYRQLPASRIAAAWMVSPETPVDAQRLRLAFALAGIAAVAAFWWLGFELGGMGLAVILALLAATSPFDLFWSRTAYVFVFPILFLTLFAASIVRLVGRLHHHGRARTGLWALAGLMAILASYSHISAWPAVALGWLFPLAVWRRRGRAGLPRSSAWEPCLFPGLWLVAVLPWLLSLPTPDGTLLADISAGVDSAAFRDRVSGLWRLPFVYLFGSGWRALFSLGLPLVALFSPHTRRPARWLGIYAAGLSVVLGAMGVLTLPSLMDFVPLRASLLALAGLGVLACGRHLRDRLDWPEARVAVVGAVAGALLLVTVLGSPIRAVSELRGNPVEYSRLMETLDELVEPGVPALVNGRSIAEVELRPYGSVRAIPTFTVSDGGFAEWFWNDWRSTAEDFLRRFPDAPLVQQGRNYYNDPRVGPWSFPETHFAQRLELRNEPALLLAKLSLAPTEDFYGGRTITEISYNRVEDLVDQARAAGRKALVLWGDGWIYEKDEELRDWRRFGERASLRLFGLGNESIDVRIRLQVLCREGSKQFRVGGVTLKVPASEEMQTVLLRQRLDPGETVLTFEDELYPLGLLSLRAASVEIEPDEPTPQGAQSR